MFISCLKYALPDYRKYVGISLAQVKQTQTVNTMTGIIIKAQIVRLAERVRGQAFYFPDMTLVALSTDKKINNGTTTVLRKLVLIPGSHWLVEIYSRA